MTEKNEPNFEKETAEPTQAELEDLGKLALVADNPDNLHEMLAEIRRELAEAGEPERTFQVNMPAERGVDSYYPDNLVTHGDRYVNDLYVRGEVALEGEELAPGMTHEVVTDEDGNETVQRRRYNAF